MILTCMNRILQNPQKYEIKHIYRYEGNTDPGDEAVVYGIQSKSGKRSSSQVLLQILLVMRHKY
jgi:hypothetical protein